MSKDELHELLMGAVLVALGYALYQHFKGAQNRAAPPASPLAVNQSRPVDVNTAAPLFTSPWATDTPGLYDLLAGSVHDITAGQSGFFSSIADEQMRTGQLAVLANSGGSGAF
jgi:hypothetical protein